MSSEACLCYLLILLLFDNHVNTAPLLDDETGGMSEKIEEQHNEQSDNLVYLPRVPNAKSMYEVYYNLAKAIPEETTTIRPKISSNVQSHVDSSKNTKILASGYKVINQHGGHSHLSAIYKTHKDDHIMAPYQSNRYKKYHEHQPKILGSVLHKPKIIPITDEIVNDVYLDYNPDKLIKFEAEEKYMKNGKNQTSMKMWDDILNDLMTSENLLLNSSDHHTSTVVNQEFRSEVKLLTSSPSTKLPSIDSAKAPPPVIYAYEDPEMEGVLHIHKVSAETDPDMLQNAPERLRSQPETTTLSEPSTTTEKSPIVESDTDVIPSQIFKDVRIHKKHDSEVKMTKKKIPQEVRRQPVRTTIAPTTLDTSKIWQAIQSEIFELEQKEKSFQHYLENEPNDADLIVKIVPNEELRLGIASTISPQEQEAIDEFFNESFDETTASPETTSITMPMATSQMSVSTKMHSGSISKSTDVPRTNSTFSILKGLLIKKGDQNPISSFTSVQNSTTNLMPVQILKTTTTKPEIESSSNHEMLMLGFSNAHDSSMTVQDGDTSRETFHDIDELHQARPDDVKNLYEKILHSREDYENSTKTEESYENAPENLYDSNLEESVQFGGTYYVPELKKVNIKPIDIRRKSLPTSQIHLPIFDESINLPLQDLTSGDFITEMPITSSIAPKTTENTKTEMVTTEISIMTLLPKTAKLPTCEIKLIKDCATRCTRTASSGDLCLPPIDQNDECLYSRYCCCPN